jgi:urease accessory protein
MKPLSKFCVVSSSATAVTLFTPAVLAHTFGAHSAGFAEGLAHPLMGLDHVLAMLAVGIWAAQLGGKALWRVPLAFLAAMTGGALAASLVELTGLETAIAASVLALGVMVALAVRVRTGVALLAVGSFAAFHGFAHGLEIPQTAAPLSYSLGFLTATAGLIGLGTVLARLKRVAQAGGVAIAAAGLLMLAA